MLATYFVYLLECGDASLYTGITNDLARRLEQHKAGKGSNYTRAKKAKKIVYSEEHPDKSSALKREAQIKRWPRAKKLRLARDAKSVRKQRNAILSPLTN